MDSNTKKLHKVLVRIVAVVSLLVVGLAFAEPGGPIRPGGGYTEPVVCQPLGLTDGAACPTDLTDF
jgi:hypothetical protein